MAPPDVETPQTVETPSASAEDARRGSAEERSRGKWRRSTEALNKPVPGPVFRVVRWISGLDALAFALLLLFWLAPGHDQATMIFGWAHGLGYITLCAAIWVAILRREAPYTLLAATLTPVGPFGSVIAIELIDRKGWGVSSPPASPASR